MLSGVNLSEVLGSPTLSYFSLLQLERKYHFDEMYIEFTYCIQYLLGIVFIRSTVIV